MTADRYVSSMPLSELPLLRRIWREKRLTSFDLEVTNRCNNDCRHCCINVPAGDTDAIRNELSSAEIGVLAEEAASLGAVSCLLTGGEPFLREDLPEIYLSLKRAGLLVSIFTNAILITEDRIRFFTRYPPRRFEVTVYGITESTYDRVTRRRGSFAAFQRGLNLLLQSELEIRLKTVALRSNMHELPDIFRFCQERSRVSYRFDPFLHLRFDGDTERNEMIRGERLSAEEIVGLEQADVRRFQELSDSCSDLMLPDGAGDACGHLFQCGAGVGNFVIGADGMFRLCSSLCPPDCVYDLRVGSIRKAMEDFVPRIRGLRSDRPEFLSRCHSCRYVNLCMWCPANAHLECGEMDMPVEYFCSLAHGRAKSLGLP